MMNSLHEDKKSKLFAGKILTMMFLLTGTVTAAPPAQQPNPTAPATPDHLRVQTSDADEAGTLPEHIDVQSMKRRYWTVGNEDLMDVVQNRRYTKKSRMEMALKFGFWSDDAFQDQKSIGLSVGYHLNEFMSVHGFYSAITASKNQAYTAATAAASGVTPSVNPGKSVMGAEARGSLIYGKLSLLGSKILYYDFNTMIGLSSHQYGSAPSGSSVGYFFGLGQQFFLNRTWFVGIDWRLLFHTDKYMPQDLNHNVVTTSRSLTTSWIQIGAGAFFP